MTMLIPTKSEKLSIEEYTKMILSDSISSRSIKSTKYEINHDWHSIETGKFVVEYDKLVLRERIL